jgi:hypothetical protein
MWLIAIILGYILGLLLIFFVIWFVWYGAAIKRKYQYEKNANLTKFHQTNGNTRTTDSITAESTPRLVSHYEYNSNLTTNSNWPISTSFGLNQICELNSPLAAFRRTNPVFNGSDDSEHINYKMLHYDYTDGFSSSSGAHSNSFIQTHRRV